jgi:CheY-like chemotaxis protein
VWRLSGVGGGTSIVYELTAAPSFDVPEFVLKRLLKRDAAQMIQGLRREMSARSVKGVVMSGSVKSLWQRVWHGGAPRSEPSMPLRVLIVDDEEGVRAFVSRVVSGAGFEVEIASDAAEALAIASTKSFDLLLTDLMMPRMYGDELARRLRLQSPGLRVLYLTGNSDLLFAKQMILLDGEAFLDKPCTKTALLEAVSLAATDRIARGSS